MFPSIVLRPRCSASWLVWTRRTRMPLVIFGGDDASRAVFLFRCQVKMLCISASMEQKDSYASVAYARLVCWLRCASRGSLLFAARPRCLASRPVCFRRTVMRLWHMHGWFAGSVAPRAVSLTACRLWLSAVAQLPVPIVICRPGLAALLWRAHRFIRYTSRPLVF